MTPADLTDTDIAQLATTLRGQGAAFAIATVVRTVGATAAKPGAKALLLADGTIAQGWIGGGCVRAALAAAAKDAVANEKTVFISLQPQDLLDGKGVVPGDAVDGIKFARNGCPSQGSMDIFIEPILPKPEMVIFGGSPVARSLAALATQFQWNVTALETASDLPAPASGAKRVVIVASQGAGDAKCVQAAMNGQAEFIAFVGSRRKFRSLSEKLVVQGERQSDLDRVHSPAGLAIEAVTPDEIALSILAQAIQIRRKGHRSGGSQDV